jgi:hypothetical protein
VLRPNLYVVCFAYVHLCQIDGLFPARTSHGVAIAAEDPGTLTPETAQVLLSDYGLPQGNMTKVAGKGGVFQRVFSKATITLDCANFTASFTPAV